MSKIKEKEFPDDPALQQVHTQGKSLLKKRNLKD